MRGPATISTVVTAATSTDLTSLDTVKDDLGITTTADDSFLTRTITQASRAISQFCNRTFAIETIRDRFWLGRDGWPGIVSGQVQPLQLTRYPLISVASLSESGIALVEDTDFIVDKEKGQIIRLLASDAYPRAWPEYAIDVTYDAGFATIPVDLEDACLRLVKGRYYARSRDPMLRGITVPEVYSAQYWVAAGTTGSMPPDVVDLIDNYRVPVLA